MKLQSYTVKMTVSTCVLCNKPFGQDPCATLEWANALIPVHADCAIKAGYTLVSSEASE